MASSGMFKLATFDDTGQIDGNFWRILSSNTSNLIEFSH